MTRITDQLKLFGTRQNGRAIRSALLFLLVWFVTVAALVGGSLGLLQLSGFMPQRETYTLQALAGATIVFGAIIASTLVSAHAWAHWLGYEGVEFIGLKRDAGRFFAGMFWGIGLIIFNFLALLTLNWLQIDRFVFDQPAVINVLIITISSVNAGVMEEVIFRGALYSALRFRWSKWAAALAVSVCFSLFHFVNNSYEFPINAALGLFIAGMLFTWAREVTGGLWIPIGIHFAWDAAIGWFNLLASQSPHLVMTTYTAPTWLIGEFGVSDWAMLLVFAISIWIYKSRLKSAAAQRA